MGRRMTKQNSTSTVKNCSQEAATDIIRNKPEYVKNSTFDIFSYVKSLSDVELRIEPLGDDISGYIEKVEDKFVIVINSLQSPLRQRFTLAHEFGHYSLHKENLEGKHQDTALFRDANEDSLGIEYAANDFAAELLIPRESFENAIKAGTNTPKQLSNLFQVTEKAILYRAYKLGIIKSFPN